MAYVYNQDQEDQQNQQQGAPQAGQPPQLSGQSAQISGAGQTPQSQGPRRSFANIGQYLQQNQQQAAGLGQKVSNFVGQKVQGANDALQQGQQQFQQQRQQNTRVFNQAAIDDFAKTPSTQAATFGQLRDKLSGNYQGPQGIDDQVFNKVSEAANTAGLVNSESGRKQLLSQIQNPRRASAGISSLNNLLLQNNAQAQAQIAQQSQAGEQLRARADEARTQAAQRAQAAKAQNQQVAQQTRDAFLGQNGIVSQFKSGIDQRAQQAAQQADKRREAAQTLLRGGDIQMTPEARAQALADIGVTEEEYDKLSRADNPLANQAFNLSLDQVRLFNPFGKYHFDAWARQNTGTSGGTLAERIARGDADHDYLSMYNDAINREGKRGKYAERFAQGTRDLSDLATVGDFNRDKAALRQQVATRDDLAKLQALNQLLGQEDQFIYDSETLGTFNPDLVNFDRIRAGLK